MPNLRLTALTLVSVTAAVASQPAHAVLQDVYASGTASSVCTPALPAYEGTIRKRPLSVQNEGATAAFVTCAMLSGNLVTRADVYISSIDQQDHIVTCTVVVGYSGVAQYLTRQVTARADGERVSLTVLPADFNRPTTLPSNLVSFSCNLPPGTGINDLRVGWQQDIGA